MPTFETIEEPRLALLEFRTTCDEQWSPATKAASWWRPERIVPN